MNQLELDAFFAIAGSGNMTEAAQNLYISQPALTKRLQMLENELSCSLVTRKKGVRSIVLTEQGKTFLELASRYRRLESEMLNVRNSRKKMRFTIYSSDGPHLYALADAYKKFALQFPDLSLRLITADYPKCFDAVETQEADIAFAAANYYYRDIVSVPVYSEPMCFICRADSSYPETVSMEDLESSMAIFSPYSADFTKWWNYWFEKEKTPFFMEAHLIEQVRDFLHSFSGDIWTIVPASVGHQFLRYPALRSGKLKEKAPERVVYMVRSIHRSDKPVGLFLNILQKSLRETRGLKCLL